ncbi:MAG: multidrug transporter ATP-binding protein [Clostridiaceae bacterium]|jgi:ABC-2 type transport system ATP-binding protein|nr:multidrug transporter ATP-binding protein [Clostridiaceae bacterium]
MTVLIEVRNLKKSYKVKSSKGIFKKIVTTNAVNGVNLKIKEGQITGLIGINGAGKTTIIKILSTLISQDEGEIYVDGLKLESNEDVIKRKLNMITSGDRMLYWQLTAKENLQYFGSLYGIASKELEERISSLLDFVGLSEKKDIPIEQFSKGMKQRLQIARGLINNPSYIFMDEPTVGLDINIAKILRAKVKELSKEQNKGILLTTHYISEIEELCDYVYVLDKGLIVFEGTPSEIIISINSEKTKYVIETSVLLPDVIDIILESLKGISINVISECENNRNYFKIETSKNCTNEIFNIINKYTQIVSFSTIAITLEEAIAKLLEDK